MGHSKNGRGSRGISARRLSSVGLLCVLPFMFGFKVPTHVASANRALDQLSSEIHPDVPDPETLSFVVNGQTFTFPVAGKEAYNAVLQNPEFFRGGTIGPDGFTDFVSGQMFQHVNESPLAMSMVEKATGGDILPESFLSSNPPTALESRTRPSQYRSIDFAMLMLQTWNAEAGNTDLFANAQERQQALAFIMGYIGHCVGDAFAHDWVNQLVGQAWDLKTGQGLFRVYTEEFQHTVVEGWINSKVPGGLQNDDGSAGGEQSRYGIRAPEKFLTHFFSSRAPGLADYGDKDSSDPTEFLKYFRNTDQFIGGPTYNYLTLQAEIGKAAENWAYIRGVVEATEPLPKLPSDIQDLLIALDTPSAVVGDVVDWTQGDLLSFFTGNDCNFIDSASGVETLLGVYNFLATFESRIGGYTEKARVARANWLKLSECTAQNIAKSGAADYDPAFPDRNRDACTVLADLAAAGTWEDNAPNGHGLVRGSVTDQAWLDQTIRHFRGEYTSAVFTLANAIGHEVDARYGDNHPELAQLQQLAFTASASGPYEPANKHRKLAQNLIRQEEYLWGPAFMMDDFKETLVSTEFGPLFKQICGKARDPGVRQCFETHLRAAATAYEAAGLGTCGKDYLECRAAGKVECTAALCTAACERSTFFSSSTCSGACGAGVSAACERALDPLCPQVCLLPPGCDIPFDGLGCHPTGVGCAGLPVGTTCCPGDLSVSPPCVVDRDEICNFSHSDADCSSFFDGACDEELILECAPDRISGIVDNLFKDVDYAAELLDPVVAFCDAVEAPLETFAEFAVDNRSAAYQFMSDNRQVLAVAGSNVALAIYMSSAWDAASPDAQVNAAFVNNDVAADAAYRSSLLARAQARRTQLLPQAADPKVALQIAGLTDFITALNNRQPLVVDINDTDPTTSWTQATTVASENVRQLNKMRALLETGIFENAPGPTLARMRRDMGLDLQTDFAPFFNTVHGLKLIPLNRQSDIEGIFAAGGVGIEDGTPWTSVGELYSNVCRDTNTTNLYCDVLASNDDPSCMNCEEVLEVQGLGWKIGRGLIPFNAYDPTGATPDHVTTFFPLATSHQAYEKLYKRVFKTPELLPEILGFEGPEGLSGWVVEQGPGTLSLDQNVRSQGGNSLMVNGCGFTSIGSKRLNTTDLGVLSHELSVDVFVPPAPGNPPGFWYGALAVTLSLPSANIYNQQLGQIELTPLGKDQFVTVRVPVPHETFLALQKDLAGLTLGFKLNTPCPQGAGKYRLDNVRFTGDVAKRSLFHTVGSRGLDVRTNALFSFENAAQWSIGPGANATLAASTTREDGLRSLAVTGRNWIPVQSTVFSGPALLGPSVGPFLNLDVFMPKPQSEYYWIGEVRVEVTCQGTPVQNSSLGSKPLTYLFENEFNSVVFPVPPDVQTALRTSAQCRVVPILNISNASNGTFLLDKMGFIDAP